MANPKATKMWFAKARQDLKTAKHLRPVESDFFSGIVFHCQQCAEKAIKGFLTYNNIRVLKTHDMDKLLKSMSKVEPQFAKKYATIRVFTKYAVEYRYPDVDLELPPLTEKSVNDALVLAEQIFDELVTLVSQEKI